MPISSPDDLVISSTESRIYVMFGRTRDAVIAVIDRESNNIVAISWPTGAIPLNSARCIVPGNLAMHPDGTHLYLLSDMGLHVIDVNNLAVKAVSNNRANLAAHCVAVDPAGTHVYVIDPEGAIVALVDSITDRMINIC